MQHIESMILTTFLDDDDDPELMAFLTMMMMMMMIDAEAEVSHCNRWHCPVTGAI